VVDDNDFIWLRKSAKLAGLAVEVKEVRGPVWVLAHGAFYRSGNVNLTSQERHDSMIGAGNGIIG
jgi:hypothetical protein